MCISEIIQGLSPHILSGQGVGIRVGYEWS